MVYQQGLRPRVRAGKKLPPGQSCGDYLSSKTSHGTIGESTFFNAPSASDTPMTSPIAGPSDFTEHLLKYVDECNEKQILTKKSTGQNLPTPCKIGPKPQVGRDPGQVSSDVSGNIVDRTPEVAKNKVEHPTPQCKPRAARCDSPGPDDTDYVFGPVQHNNNSAGKASAGVKAEPKPEPEVQHHYHQVPRHVSGVMVDDTSEFEKSILDHTPLYYPKLSPTRCQSPYTEGSMSDFDPAVPEKVSEFMKEITQMNEPQGMIEYTYESCYNSLDALDTASRISPAPRFHRSIKSDLIDVTIPNPSYDGSEDDDDDDDNATVHHYAEKKCSDSPPFTNGASTAINGKGDDDDDDDNATVHHYAEKRSPISPPLINGASPAINGEGDNDDTTVDHYAEKRSALIPAFINGASTAQGDSDDANLDHCVIKRSSILSPLQYGAAMNGKGKILSDSESTTLDGPSDFSTNILHYLQETARHPVPPPPPPPVPSQKAATAPLHAQIAALQAQLQMKDDTVATLETRLEKKDDILITLQSKLQDKDDTLITLQSKVQHQDEVVATLKSELEDKDDVVATLQSELEDKDDVVATLQSELEDKDDAAVNLQSELEHKDDVVATLQSELQKKDDVAVTLESELEQKDDVVATLESELEHKDDVMATLQSELKHKDDVVVILQSEIQTRDDVVSSLRSRIQTKDRALNTLESKFVKKDAASKRADARRRRELAESEQRELERETEWHHRAALLLDEVDRRGDACLNLWGQMEHPGEVDDQGRQKYGYQFLF